MFETIKGVVEEGACGESGSRFRATVACCAFAEGCAQSFELQLVLNASSGINLGVFQKGCLLS